MTLNPSENMSTIHLSVVIDNAEQAPVLTKVINESINGVLQVFGTKVEDMSSQEGRLWYTHDVMVQASDVYSAMTMLNELCANLAVDASRYGFEPGVVFSTTMTELVDTEGQSEEAGGIEAGQLEQYYLSNVHIQNVRQRQLLRRIADLESNVNELTEQHNALVDNVRAQKVMNFDYNAFHKLPQMITAMVEVIGEESLRRKYEELFEAERFTLRKIQ